MQDVWVGEALPGLCLEGDPQAVALKDGRGVDEFLPMAMSAEGKVLRGMCEAKQSYWRMHERVSTDVRSEGVANNNLRHSNSGLSELMTIARTSEAKLHDK